MGAVRIGWTLALLALDGCCLSVVTGGTGKSSSGSGTGGATSTGGTTTGTSAAGSSTGSFIPTLTLTYLLDAGIGTVFGPVALSLTPTDGGSGIAKLVYSGGQPGSFEVTLQALSEAGMALGDPIAVAATDAALISPPNVTVFDDGRDTAVCWEDYGSTSNPFLGECMNAGENPLVLCATVAEGGSSSESYSACGSRPLLVFNGASAPLNLDGGDLQLYYQDYVDVAQVWAYGYDVGISASWGPINIPFAVSPLAPNLDEIVHAADGGLVATLIYFSGGGYSQSSSATIDPLFATNGQLAVTSKLDSEALGVLELDDSGLRATSWQFDGGAHWLTAIPAPTDPIGPLGATSCPSGFGFLAITDGGDLLLAKTLFDGEIASVAGGLFALDDFESTATSLAVAPNLDGGLLIAVSSPGQIAVYVVGCQ